MARYEISDEWTAQAYRFVLDPTPMQVEAFRSHAGGARFAYNVMLAAVKANLDQRAAERSYGVREDDLTPLMEWSFQSLRNDFNRRKHKVAVRADGTPWWTENSKEVYANACRGLADALSNWSASRRGIRGGQRMRFPRFKTKAAAANKFSFTTGAIRVEPDRRHVTLPRLGTIRTHESTRKLARRMDAGVARVLKATVRFERGRWQVSFTCLVRRGSGRPAHVKSGAAVVGIDAGVKDLIVVADPDGNELARHRAPRELRRAHQKLRAMQRKAARQVGPWDTSTFTKRRPSRGWERTQRDIARVHARVAQLRADRLHKLTTQLSQKHGVIGGETLTVRNMMARGGSRKRGLNRAFGDAGLGELFRQLAYKTGWYGSQMVKADRWFPSSKMCSGCGVVKAKLHLAERTYKCDCCGLVIDRDLNAAVNLARYAQQQTDPSTGFITGGADRKSSPRSEAGGSETRTRTEVGDHADDGGSASPKGEAA
ncbi:IS607 family element RNA-guided endonuclease TnpB [[Mycobacterium] appelbergii]|uniref:IS607 family element RNA-guided endonuclease TnpB n=1 Tax=[Mycobacterium] appelbergii TaxID=2939269 RepID=UPI002938F3B2|nr:IS607 family element RNA-guided endonuclease TnpB [Mycobacterium sp. 21AC1]